MEHTKQTSISSHVTKLEKAHITDDPSLKDPSASQPAPPQNDIPLHVSACSHCPLIFISLIFQEMQYQCSHLRENAPYTH